jgi:hypothetical protein
MKTYCKQSKVLLETTKKSIGREEIVVLLCVTLETADEATTGKLLAKDQAKRGFNGATRLICNSESVFDAVLV